MTVRVHLGLVFHQHQPVGNHDFVFEELFRNSYEPLVACLERHPGIKAGLHYSGPLIDWLVIRQPGYVERVRSLVSSGQVEIVGGAYYEPVLPAIGEADRLGQLRKMREDVSRIFGATPRGAWVAERVWEPELPRSLAEAGYSWTIVDDVHFEGAGIHSEDLNGWFLTEAEGRAIAVYGSDTRMRYLVPWATVDDCIDYLRQKGERHPGALVVIGDDGEKFGGWPTTYAHCWEQRWVDDFFTRIEKESSWLSTVTLGQWRDENTPQSLVYLPSASYMEMGEWSLPPADQHDLERAKSILREKGAGDLVRFLRGGHWRNFLVRYPEVNLLHKRLLHLSAEAHRQGKSEAIDHIWQAQCNCPFWHGVFGGVYLEHIRHANFHHLAVADALLFPGEHEPDVRDWNFDGANEICLRSASHAVVIAPGQGGEIQHWDLRQKGWHLTHAVARRPEAYHVQLTPTADGLGVHSIHDAVRLKDDAALAQLGNYDRGLRVAAQETILPPGATRDRYASERLREPATVRKWAAENKLLTMECEAAGVGFRKSIELGAGLEVHYALESGATLFSEWNLSLPSGPGGGEPVFDVQPERLFVETERFTLEVVHNADDAWVERLYSVSNTEDGVELAPQGWTIAFSTSSPVPREIALRWSVTA